MLMAENLDSWTLQAALSALQNNSSFLAAVLEAKLLDLCQKETESAQQMRFSDPAPLPLTQGLLLV